MRVVLTGCVEEVLAKPVHAAEMRADPTSRLLLGAEKAKAKVVGRLALRGPAQVLDSLWTQAFPVF